MVGLPIPEKVDVVPEQIDNNFEEVIQKTIAEQITPYPAHINVLTDKPSSLSDRLHYFLIKMRAFKNALNTTAELEATTQMEHALTLPGLKEEVEHHIDILEGNAREMAANFIWIASLDRYRREQSEVVSNVKLQI